MQVQNFEQLTLFALLLTFYFRIAVTVAFGIIIMNTSLIKKLVGPSNFYLMVFNEQACRIHWIQALLLINNFYYTLDIVSKRLQLLHKKRVKTNYKSATNIQVILFIIL